MQFWRHVDVLRAAVLVASQIEHRAMLLALGAVTVGPSTAAVNSSQAAPQHLGAQRGQLIDQLLLSHFSVQEYTVQTIAVNSLLQRTDRLPHLEPRKLLEKVCYFCTAN
jgi:hypothetical protein